MIYFCSDFDDIGVDRVWEIKIKKNGGLTCTCQKGTWQIILNEMWDFCTVLRKVAKKNIKYLVSAFTVFESAMVCMCISLHISIWCKHFS